jgi:hypothetical protein
MAVEIPRWLAPWERGELMIDDGVVGTVRLPSGSVVACDPLVALESTIPFERKVPPGEYPVVLGRAEGDCVLACVRFGKEPVRSWEVALRAGEDGEDGAPGYVVESGAGCFVDAQSASSGGAGIETIIPAVRRQGWASIELDPKGRRGNLVAFASGGGDGASTSFWGLDGTGRPACLVTDLGLIDDEALEEDDDVEPDDEPAEAGSRADDADEGPLGEERLRQLLAELDDDAEPAEGRAEPEPVSVSPAFTRVREILAEWESGEKIELDPECDREALAEALLEVLGKLEGHRRVGAHLAEWLIERPEVQDLFASDAELEADLRR